jgi:hypothetical protein
MTLKEKFSDVQDAYHDRSDECEKIAEDFALEFGKWLNNKVISPSGKHHDLLGIVKVDTLLVIFKKEKGL